MARLILAIGSSHSPMLGSAAEEVPLHAARDKSNPELLDRDGRLTTFEALLETADPAWGDELTASAIANKADRCQDGISRLAETLRDAAPDAVIVVGDDQHEQFLDDNLPSLAVYAGDEIHNGPVYVPPDAPDYWRRARSVYSEPNEEGRLYPVDRDLAEQIITTFMQHGFDTTVSRRLPQPRGEGHAFGYVHRQLMRHGTVPIVPVLLNTYFPPNQPTPVRCVAIGKAIAAAVESYPGDANVAIVASGGLSHFVVDAELDRNVLTAFCVGDLESLASLPSEKLNSGTSEIRNWITVAAAAHHAGLRRQWSDYVPFYRTLAGTGCGIAYAVLS